MEGKCCDSPTLADPSRVSRWRWPRACRNSLGGEDRTRQSLGGGVEEGLLARNYLIWQLSDRGSRAGRQVPGFQRVPKHRGAA